MGCGCGGSVQQTSETVVQEGVARRVEGGPGQPGYTWNGPQIPAQAPREATPVPAAAATE
jgi:hypothetical protein